MEDEIIKILPPKLPFGMNDKVFQDFDEEGNPIGDEYSMDDFIREIINISGITEEFLGVNDGR